MKPIIAADITDDVMWSQNLRSSDRQVELRYKALPFLASAFRTRVARLVFTINFVMNRFIARLTHDCDSQNQQCVRVHYDISKLHPFTHFYYDGAERALFPSTL